MYSPRIAVELRGRGHDVVHAAELDLAGTSDDDVFAVAVSERRAIVTNNVDDFVRIFARAADEQRGHAGILLTSDRSLPRSVRTTGLYVRVLEELLNANPAEDAFSGQLRWITPD